MVNQYNMLKHTTIKCKPKDAVNLKLENEEDILKINEIKKNMMNARIKRYGNIILNIGNKVHIFYFI